MPDNNQQIAAARKVYETYWDSYLKGDLETFTSTLDETYEMIGTSEKEVCHTKAEGIDFLKGQIAEVVGKAELRNRQIKVIPVEQLVLINEHADIYVMAEAVWILYSKIRISTWLRKTEKGWKVIQQHGSLPDMRVQEGETMAIEKINRENLELRDAVKRRTIELEHKNRELEIEAALERVRTIAMGMKKPGELLDVCRTISEQLELLHIGNIRNVQVAIIDEPKKIYANYQYFTAYAKGIFEETGYENNRASLAMVTEMQKSANAFFIGSIKGDELKKFSEWRKDFNQLPDPILDQSTEMCYYFYSIGQGGLGLTTYRAINENELEIFKRFHLVFKLAYRRFMDIQQAEAQAREAQVEAALERIRSLALGMIKSEEVGNVTDQLFTELINLNVDMNGASIVVIDEDTDKMELWRARSNVAVKPFESTSFTESMDVLKNYMPDWFPTFFEALGKRKNYLIDELAGDKRSQFIHAAAEQYKYSEEEKSQLLKNTPEKSTAHFIFFKLGYLALLGEKQLSEENLSITRRFVEVFDFSYTRFLDIQKAEAQAREAKIEVALEKVRSRTMGMQNSEEMQEVANLMFLEIQSLGIPAWSCGYNILSADKKVATNFMSNEGTLQKPFDLPLTEEASLIEFHRFLLSNESFFTQELGGNDIESHYNFMKTLPELAPVFKGLDEAGIALPTYQINHLCKFTHGYLLFITYEPVPDAHDIFKRFTKVFDQTYTRFLDLQKAEAQARESQLELSLERIRAQVTAMQESAELLDIVVMMRTEFVNLGHEAHYFWYMRWLPEKYEKVMTSGDGTRIGMVMSLPRHIHGDVQLVADWEKSNEPAVVFAMDEETAVDYVHKMITLGDFEQVDPQAPTLDDIRDLGGLTFIMARTQHGEIGFSLPGTVPDPPKDAVETLRRFAGVFDLAYKRFEDLKNAEKDLIEIKQARQNAEDALIELRATQTQLVQQEKLASLGQLTAGIAHEIKNPLNFVNNFSEVSIELIDEALEQLALVKTRHALSPSSPEALSPASTTAASPATTPASSPAQPPIHEILDDIKDILSDTKQNLTKIHEHGTRANGIVTSMLQHSRGGSGKMEPTDLNALIKEYVNLSFHGMRAGKNPINVTIDLQLDEEIKTVLLVEEDFSRVLLNLCNNAFDAMRETADMRQPSLTVRTKLESKQVLIEVEDNGPGISDEIKDKILQPFFTTKKGTEGTGLGLSISNDIIKAHGGSLDIESSAKGSIFKIHISK
jgi:signal transduction histidine kinase